MESRKARLKIIRNWMSKETGSASSPVPVGDDTLVAKASFHYLSKGAPVEEVAESLRRLLCNYHSRSFFGRDWTVRILVPDGNCIVDIVSEANELDLALRKCASPSEAPAPMFDLALPCDELRLLVNFEVDLMTVLIRTGSISDNSRPFIRPFSDLLFGAYSLHHLYPAFDDTILKTIYASGKVSNLNGDERYLFPWAISSDIGCRLYDLVMRKDITRTLEIGLAFGLSALFMCQAHKNKKVGHHTAIDPCQTVEFQSIGVDQIKKAGLQEQFELLEEKDYEIMPMLARANRKFDMVFIDGLHMHDYVVLDYFYSDVLLEVNGILAFDDCQAPGVSSAVAYLEKNRNYRFLEQYSDYRLRIYQKLSEDTRSIVSPNHHIEYFRKSEELALISSSAEPTRKSSEPVNRSVAIIGIHGVLPACESLEEFWDALSSERVMYGPYSTGYLYQRSPEVRTGQAIVGGMIESAFSFDPYFFRISNSEAAMLDPQLRHLLMSTYKAIEDAGYVPQQLSAARVGVFVGAEGSDYNELHRSRALEDGYILNHAGSCLANRLSYYFDFKGPSEVINTMCSSGAACIHRAVELLRGGEIDFAVVAAVKINFSDLGFQSLINLNIATGGNACYSFHRDSDGYIRSEGVVTMVLRSAQGAAEDLDHVYAHVREVALNYNGKDGNSMFAPSKNGQKEVIKRCYRNAGVAMSELTFIEAQGMGNEIADLVEFSAINEAYAELMHEAGNARSAGAAAPPISTIKPILGHMECVSALGAVLKIIRSFQTHTIYRIPFLDAENINRNLDLESAPCTLLTQDTKVDAPMLAGLNSFGASGTNVHMLLQAGMEHEPDAQAGNGKENALPVSARSPESLRQYVEDIYEFLEQRQTADLAALCSTFQLRRSHFEHRVIFFIEEGSPANQRASLRGLLQIYLLNEKPALAIQDNQKGSRHYFNDKAMSAQAQSLSEKGRAWLAGDTVDWRVLYAGVKLQKRGGLPTYPFLRGSYRLEMGMHAERRSTAEHTAVHPLLQRGVSTSGWRAYSSTFTGNEFFLRDHQVNGSRIFPAVGYLEMIGAALISAGSRGDGEPRLENVVWANPLLVDAPTDVSIVLSKNGAQKVDYEIFSEGGNERIVHCEGSAIFAPAAEPRVLDLADLRSRALRKVFDAADFYRMFARMGISYGPAHRAVTEIYSSGTELLAYLRLPESVEATLADYVLHPGLMDSALQAAMAFMAGNDFVDPYLPFSLDSLTVLAPCRSDMVAVVRHSEISKPKAADVRGELQPWTLKVDVDICEPGGKVCVQVRGLFSRFVNGTAGLRAARADAAGNESGTEAYVHASVVADLTTTRDEVSASSMDNLRDTGIRYVRSLVAENLGAPPASIKPDVPLTDYGFDSILIVRLTKRLREQFPDIKTTLFFEVQTIASLVDHLLENNLHDMERLPGQSGHAYRAGSAETSSPGTSNEAQSREPSRQLLRTATRAETHRPSPTPVAIIGLSGRYPKSGNIDQFWVNLVNGINCITEIPDDRWQWEDYYSPKRNASGKMYTRWGGFIDHFDKFDPLFFQIAPLEAERMDPQERVFLETCYHAVEDAGYTPKNLDAARKVGVFVGVMNSMYTPEPDHYSIANRISYLFDFQGPSLAVDTACSSSLTAIHLALESIYSGSCGTAIAGGVNLVLSPAHLVRLSEINVLSAGDRCKSFGEHADGMIAAEGVGAVVLKPLQQAERDGDHIYGVLIASAINASGKTNGYTVPNPKAHAALIGAALEKADLPPGSVSYIEAHGTGTALGDPIEIAGLTLAFGRQNGAGQSSHSCAIGSVKSNIGHAEAAAGIAGLTKILLQLKYRRLVPSLHADAANPEIDFSRTPFKVQKVLTPWERPRIGMDGALREIPRTAGISSFGVGGANAHLIVQEYIPGEPREGVGAHKRQAKTIVPLSARTAEQLQRKVRDLLAFITPPSAADAEIAHQPTDISSLAYTLQVGREAMDLRLCVVVCSLEELVAELKAYIEHDSGSGACYQGERSEESDILMLFDEHEDLRDTIGKWAAEGKVEKLAQLWVHGVDLDWNSLYGNNRPGRISLPLYPFARDRHWMNSADRLPVPVRSSAGLAPLHPLLHVNTSNFSQQSYATSFSGNEFFLRDHQISSGGSTRKILPAVAYLEMIRAAVAQAMSTDIASSIVEIQNVVWAQPFVFAENRPITITLRADRDHAIGFEVASPGSGTGERVIHCEGQALCVERGPRAKIDIASLRAGVSEGLEVQAIYDTFVKAGITHGPSHQALKAVHRGSDYVVAELVLQLAGAASCTEYVLHPGLMDSALHAALVFQADVQHAQLELSLPFAVESVRILAPCEPNMYACIRQLKNGGTESRTWKLNIELLDVDGNLCVQMSGLSFRKLATDATVTASAPQQADTVLARPVWSDVSVQETDAAPAQYVEHHVVLCEVTRSVANELEPLLAGARCLQPQASSPSVAHRYGEYAQACLTLIQDVLRRKPVGGVLIQVVIPDDEDHAPFAGLSGLLKTAALEEPVITGQVVLAPAALTPTALAARIRESAMAGHHGILRYEHGMAQTQRWEAIPRHTGAHNAFRENGLYLITGGLGGLGILFAKEISTRTANARIVLTGRSQLTAQKQALLEELDAGMGRVEYRPLDLGKREEIAALIASVEREYGCLTGIIHCAGMLADGFIAKKTTADLRAVLAPKVEGTLNLDEASREIDLDFFVLFSSGAAVTGNIGQADYAAANAFMDHFAALRNRLVEGKRRRGKSVAINWPFWQDGGMPLAGPHMRLLEERMGMQPMQTAVGMAAFHRIVSLGYPQVAVLHGDVARIWEALGRDSSGPHADTVDTDAPVNGVYAGNLLEQTQHYLCRQLAALLKLAPDQVDPRAPLEKYGMDSILAMKLTNRLELTFGSLSKTLLFEYQTIGELSRYFVDFKRARLAQLFAGEVAAQGGVKQAATANAKIPPRIAKLPAAAAEAVAIRPSAVSEVAIIGLSGRYPQAEDVEEFWINLKNGRDCITEIPPDRWDHSQCFDADKSKIGKTYSKWGGFLADVDKFDALFFNITPREAELLDPQERLFIETAWHTIEDAGYSKESVSRSRTGVYVGVMWGHYELYAASHGAHGGSPIPNSSYASIANRVSYFFDFHGPSMAVDTMCSSSLTAIHLASEDIRRGDTELAIAGGVNLSIHPQKYLSISQGSFAASDGKCRSFGEGGDGYVPGEGVGAVLLKPLAQALRDGDHVYGVIKSSAINHGGKTNGYTVPNPVAQASLIYGAIAKANVDPATITYIEAHGTGTALGDPIEIAALARAFADHGVAMQGRRCAIGSVKSNIGHLESAAGIAALTKVLLQIKHRQLVPSLHATPPNPHIRFEETPFRVQTELEEWTHAAEYPRRIGISSFGAGGSNAHLIIEEYPAVDSVNAVDPALRHAFVLSARDKERLLPYAKKFTEFLRLHPETALADLAFTSQVGRTPMNERVVVLASSVAELARKLTNWVERSGRGAATSAEEVMTGEEGIFYGNATASRAAANRIFESSAAQEVLDVIIARRELDKLAELWVTGIAVDWSRLHPASGRKRISLPGYPFAKERHWLAPPALHPMSRNVSGLNHADSAPGTAQAYDYYPRWVRAPLVQDETDSRQDAPLMIFTATEELYTALVTRSQALGAKSVFWVKPGLAFEASGAANTFVLDWKKEEHFVELLDTLRERNCVPHDVVYLCGNCPVGSEANAGLQYDGESSRDFFALLGLAKALIRGGREPRHSVLAVNLNRGGLASPWHAALSGFLRTLQLEHPGYHTKNIMIQNVSDLADVALLIRKELVEGAWSKNEVRYERNHEGIHDRFSRELAIFNPVSNTGGESPLKEQGVYVVSGGLGGLGLIFSEYLARRFSAKLIILGRSAIDRDRREKLDRLTALGAEAMYLQADVARLDEVSSAIRRARIRFGRIDGVIHGAGINNDSFILKKNAAQVDAVLGTKIGGALNLDKATSDDRLDVFIMFSSLSGLMGNIGQCDYAYANRFLDAFAEHREELRTQKQRSGKTLAINWPLWEAGGMNVAPDAIETIRKQTGLVPLPTQTGIAYWEKFLQSELVQGIALYGDAGRIAGFVAASFNPSTREESVPQGQRSDNASLLEQMEAYLKTLIGSEIKLAPERIDSAEPLESLGIDSVSINRLNVALENDLGSLSKTLLYEYETIAELAQYLIQRHRQTMIGVLGVRQSEQEAAPAATAAEMIALEMMTMETTAVEASALEAASRSGTPREATSSRAAEPVRLDAPQEKYTDKSARIAIVGMHGLYPKSRDLNEYWDNLKEGRNLIDLVPPERWSYEAFYDPDPERAVEGKIYCKWGGFLDDFDKFDPSFFNLGRQEAALVDPQERLFLQSVWSAIEDAGYTRSTVKTDPRSAELVDVGVFVGVTTHSYHLLGLEERDKGHVVTSGAIAWSIANRVSYFFDFQGPSLPVDTACSSSLVAIHMACDSLRSGACRVALAGGVNLYLHPSKYHSLCQNRMVSTDGKCHSFGAGDDGFVPGEGVGSVLLKPLADALDHKDHIYGVIAGSGFAHGGRSNGYTAPNPNSQAALIGGVLEAAKIDPDSITYVEGHGTGTQLGDSLEITALTNAFHKRTTRKQFCSVGSVKANIGHLEAAAGIAALAKVLLQMKHGQLIPSICSDEINPNIDFGSTPFYLQRETTPWAASSRRALINSFGAGGVNACLVVEEYVRADAAQEVEFGPFLVVLSARKEARLTEYVDDLLAYLRAEKRVNLRSLAYTLQVGREQMEERLAIVVHNVRELVEQIAKWKDPTHTDGLYRGSVDPKRLRKSSKRGAATPAGSYATTDLASLAQRWVSGELVDWQSLYGDDLPYRMSLPTYPFAKERYWISDSAIAAKSPVVTTAAAQVHPWLSHNASTLHKTCFASVLSHAGFFAVDHLVNGERLFPGAGFLEIACIAGSIAGERPVCGVRDVVWMRPLHFQQEPRQLRTLLTKAGKDSVFEIISVDADGTSVIHSEGKLCFEDAGTATAARQRLEIQHLKRGATVSDGAAVYAKFRDFALDYGPAFRTIRELHVGEAFALATLRIDESSKADFDQYVIHPCLVDGALQTLIGLAGEGGSPGPFVPFALGELRIYGQLPHTCLAYVRYSDGQSSGENSKEFDIDIMNKNGDVLVSVKNLCVRPLGIRAPAAEEEKALVTT